MLLGLGASSISKLPQGFVQNHAVERLWRGAVDRVELPTARGVALTAEDRFRGEIIERLMCDLAVDLDEVRGRHGQALTYQPNLDEALVRLAPFIGDGLAVTTASGSS